MLDCLYQMKCVDFAGKQVVDVGSGGGFPGVPLQIANPTAQFLLLDSRKKRVDFLQEVCQTMGLPARALAGRAEEVVWQKGMRESFDVAVSRAVAPLNILCELCMPFVKSGGFFLAMKSHNPAAQQEVLAAGQAIQKLGGKLVQQASYRLPGTEIDHQVVVVEKGGPHPQRISAALCQDRIRTFVKQRTVGEKKSGWFDRRLFFFAKIKGRWRSFGSRGGEAVTKKSGDPWPGAKM